jgi:hypothetical protein
MTSNEFTNKLCAFYREAAFENIAGKKVPNVRVEEVRGFVKRLAPDLLDSFWVEVVTKFLPTAAVTFPTPANLSDIWNDMPDKIANSGYNDFQKTAIEEGRDLTVKQINDRVDEIRREGVFTNRESNFIDVWEHLATIWGMMWDHKMEPERIFAYTNKMKDVILEGKKINAGAACGKLFGKKEEVKLYGEDVRDQNVRRL